MQTLVISKDYYNSLSKPDNVLILKKYGYKTADEFIEGTIKIINQNFNFFEVKNFRFFTLDESKRFTMYSSFIDNFESEIFKDNLICFSPIKSKLGNTIISQELLPILSKRIDNNPNFLFDKRILKIFILASEINSNNKIKNIETNTLYLNVKSLNSMGFKVIQQLKISGLSLNSSFNNVNEYLSFIKDLKEKNSANDQSNYIFEKDGIVYGNCSIEQLEGQFTKFLSFRFLTTIMLGRENFKYNIDSIIRHGKLDNQLNSLVRIINFISNNSVEDYEKLSSEIEEKIDINESDLNNVNRKPIASLGKFGSKRYRTNKNIKDKSFKIHNYLCSCHDEKHFYFESTSLENYLEGHHIIPMNMQDLYWDESTINLDVLSNLVPLCPNCHTKVHNGSRSAKLEILAEIYVKNEKKVMEVDKNISFSKLSTFYNIILSESEEEYFVKLGHKKANNKMPNI